MWRLYRGNKMTKTELRSLYNQDMLVEAVVEHSLLTDAWILEFRHSRGGYVPLTDINGDEQVFEDPDMAMDRAMEIGFNQVRVLGDE